MSDQSRKLRIRLEHEAEAWAVVLVDSGGCELQRIWSWLLALVLVLEVVGAYALGRLVGDPQPLYVCCTAAGGCEPKPPSECTGDLYWCEVGESTSASGLPAVICHDDEGEP